MRRLAVLVTTLGIAVGGLLAAGAPASAQSDAPKATDIGVTAKAIRIAVVADVDNPFAPSLFQGGVNGVKAAVEYINSQGGVAGRKLELDVIDSQLNPAKTRDAIITACSDDFALVGTAAAFMTTIEDEVNCPDEAGKVTGLPDFAAFVTGVQQCSPVAFPVNPPQLVCSTKDEKPQTYHGSTGSTKYFQKLAGTKLHGLYLASNDSAVATRQQDLLLAFPEHAGMKSDQHPYVSSKDPQSAYTPMVQKLKADNSNFAWSGMGSAAVIALRQEAELQGFDNPDMLWLCLSCYDETLPASESARRDLPAARDPSLRRGEAQQEPRRTGQARRHGQARPVLDLRLRRDAAVQAGGRGCRRQGRRQRGDPGRRVGGGEGHHQLRRRRHDRREQHRRAQDRAVLPRDAGQEQEVDARVPLEAGHLRLQPQEHHDIAARRDRLTPWISTARSRSSPAARPALVAPRRRRSQRAG